MKEYITCPCCETDYSTVDAPLECKRVMEFSNDASQNIRDEQLLQAGRGESVFYGLGVLKAKFDKVLQ